jgi:hypothetical protein
MIGIALFLLCQTSGDTMRWYDTTTAGWTGIGIHEGYPFRWGVILPIDSPFDGRTVHSGRVYIWEPTPMPAPGAMKLCTGTLDSPITLLDSGSFYSPGQGFYEVFFGDTLALHEGDLIWLWCSQFINSGQFPAGVDSGPAVQGYGDLLMVGNTWGELLDWGLNYNWVMELVLTPLDVEEGPAKPEPEELFLITSFTKSEIKISYAIPHEDAGHVSLKAYDIAGREAKCLLDSETQAGWYEAQWRPPAPGVYFLVLMTPANILTAKVVAVRR